VELKTVQAVDIAMDGGGGCDADAALGAAADVCCDTDVERLGGCLGDYTRQMAVSLMALHVSCMLQFFFLECQTTCNAMKCYVCSWFICSSDVDAHT
jgi:hypothetical protein